MIEYMTLKDLEQADYRQALEELATMANDTYAAATVVMDKADNEDGAPYEDIRKLTKQLLKIADDLNCICDHNCTRDEIDRARALYEGAKLAGLTQ